MKLAKSFLLSFLLVFPLALHAESTIESNATSSVGKFVQDFYDWYAPLAANPHAGPAWDAALHARLTCFSADLRRELQEE